VAVDGTRLKANASKHKAMSYGRMMEKEAELKREIQELLERAEAIDRGDNQRLRLASRAPFMHYASA
jgi:hypothetical protein